MHGLVNTLAGADEEDILNLAEYLDTAFRDEFAGDQIAAFRRLPPHIQPAVLRGAVSTILGDLHRTKHRQGKPTPLTLEEQEDLALIKTKRALEGRSSAQWERIAQKAQKSVEEVQKETWKKVFIAYRNTD